MREGLIEEIETEQREKMGITESNPLKPWFPMKLILLMREYLRDKYVFEKEFCYLEGHIFDVRDKTDGQVMTIRLTPKIKDWRDEYDDNGLWVGKEGGRKVALNKKNLMYFSDAYEQFWDGENSLEDVFVFFQERYPELSKMDAMAIVEEAWRTNCQDREEAAYESQYCR